MPPESCQKADGKRISGRYIRRTRGRPLEEQNRIITFNYHRESINYFNQNHPSQNIENLAYIILRKW